MYKRILLPLDGSPLAEQALPHAIALAEHFHSELILLRVLTPLPSPPPQQQKQLYRGHRRRWQFWPASIWIASPAAP